MKELLTLGDIYVSDFIKEGEIPRGDKSELKLLLDDDGCVRLANPVSVNKMFGKYWYRSGTNESMKKGLKDVVDSILYVTKYKTNDIWVDIGANDGTLLSYVPQDFVKIAIDPVEDSFKEEVERNSDLFIQDYFTAEGFKKYYGNQKAKVVTSIAMFYDIIDREKFLGDISEVLDDNGVWVLQQSYTPLMLKQLAFDNICHEHVYYYSLFNIKKLLERNCFKIMDCQVNDVNGGSFRLFVMKQKGDETKFASQPHRDVCNLRIDSLLEYEKTFEMESRWTWFDFMEDIKRLRDDVLTFICSETQKGKVVYGYGGSTKGNTLLQYFGLDETLITAIADRSPYKIGLRTVGTNIPICSEEDMRKAQPDYLLILPWHFITEFKEREKEYFSKGGKFIVPCPKLQIIGND
jgi:mRNA-degrading endonuclease HigB of HigAB toxin-antitoxin module